MQDMEYDVVVVGAGPAGSTTAKFAAMGGASVLMIEKRQEIGSPVRCGEGIARWWLDKVGIKLDKRWVAHEVEGARIISPDGTEFCINERIAGNEVGTVIERDLFDKALAYDAGRAGVDIMVKTTALGLHKEGERVVGIRAKHMGEEFNVKARLVIGADGFESQIGRWAGIDTSIKPADATTCLQYRMTGIEPNPNYCDFYLGSLAPGGYIWVFPKNEDTANVGIGLQVKKLTRPGMIRECLDKFVQGHPEIAKGTVIDMVGGGVSISPPLDRTVADGIMLVGDAARMIDPVTGGGIANGCLAGKVCGEVAAKAVEAGDVSGQFLQEYENGWRDILENGLYRNWMAKEKIVTLSDDVFNKMISTLAEVGVNKLSVRNILSVIQEKHPELVEEFSDLI